MSICLGRHVVSSKSLPCDCSGLGDCVIRIGHPMGTQYLVTTVSHRCSFALTILMSLWRPRQIVAPFTFEVQPFNVLLGFSGSRVDLEYRE